MSKDWRAYAEHILAAAAKLDRIATRGDIAEDDILYDAALRNLQTMAEASQKLPESLKAPYPEIEWRKISAFRNVIAHTAADHRTPTKRHAKPLILRYSPINLEGQQTTTFDPIRTRPVLPRFTMMGKRCQNITS